MRLSLAYLVQTVRVTRWIVDAANVIGSRPDGWWRDRPGAIRRLIAELAVLLERGDQVVVVLDGRVPSGVTERPGLRVLPADRRGRDAADDRIVAYVADDPEPDELTVVTADRALTERVGRLGASVLGPRTLLSRVATRSDGQR